jgi:hypothetical protein
LGLTAKTSRAVPVTSLAKVYEARVEDYTRAAEQTDDQVFRRMLLTLALQFTLAAQEERAKSKQQQGTFFPQTTRLTYFDRTCRGV